MQAISNNQLTGTLEKRVEAQLQEAVSVFQNLPEEILLQPSATGGWSIAQCLAHLNSYGHYYLPVLQTQLQKAEAATDDSTFKSGWLGNYFTRMMEPSTGKRKLKAFKGYTPGTDIDAYQTVAEFIQQQETLLSYIQVAKHRDLNRVCVPISIAKWVKLKLGDVLLFLVAHNQRHIEQAKRNL